MPALREKEGGRMSEELSGALADLARGLGTTTGELWAWMQSDGIDAYARAQVAKYAVGTFLSVTILVVCIVAVVATARIVKRDCESNPFPDDGDAFFELILFEITPTILTVFTGAFACDQVTSLIGWLASPEGMVISMLVERL